METNLIDTAVISGVLPTAPNGARVGKVRGVYLADGVPFLIVQDSAGTYRPLGLGEVSHADRSVWARRAEVPAPASEEVTAGN